MTVNGLELPAAFVKFFEEHWCTNWELKENTDAWGNPLETHFEPLDTVQGMGQDTAALASSFGPPDLSRYPPQIQEQVRADRATAHPGFLPDITDFSKIVQFGRTPAGAPFCFDFRENPAEPSVIHFDEGDARWRRVAPSFDAFISLFKRYEEEEWEGEEA